LSENLLVDGTRIIVTPGGSKALVAALDKNTGETIWASEPLKLGQANTDSHVRLDATRGGSDSASYASPILFKLGNRRLIVNCSLQHVFGADADTGELLWSRPLVTRYQVIPMTPVVVGDAIFVTAPHSEGGKLYGLKADGPGVRVDERWRTELNSCQGGVVHVNGALYGAMYEPREKWLSLDAQTGKVRYRLEDLARGSLLYADKRLYCLSEEGEVALLNPTAKKFEVAGRFRLVPGRKSDAWTHPVISNGRLYLRYHETLFCYDVRAK
jgi:outer membrane protein assembly factor BamB